MFIRLFTANTKDPYCIGVSGGADLVLYAAMNVAGFYTKYLTDRAGRKAFLETRRSLEMRCKAAKENEKQEKLLLSGPSIAQFMGCGFVLILLLGEAAGCLLPFKNTLTVCNVWCSSRQTLT